MEHLDDEENITIIKDSLNNEELKVADKVADEILQKEEDRFVQIMKLFMSKDLGDNVILMNNQELTSSCFYCKVIKEIQVNSNLLEGYLIQLRLTCQKLNIPLVEVK